MKTLFWNFKESFIGLKFLRFTPKNILLFPIIMAVPFYAYSQIKTGIKEVAYFDEYDSDNHEK